MSPAKKFPPEFVEKIRSRLSRDADDFFSSLSQPPYLSVRINPFKPTDKFDSYETVPWCNEGKYLLNRPSFTFDPLFHAGTYYVQEPSSMFLSEIFKQAVDRNKTLNVLDLCAAPGGKSTLILGEISGESLLISNETIRSRVPVLHENIIKWGVPNVFVTSNDPGLFSKLTNFFDIIVIDAPCSGEGLFRKDERAIAEWSKHNVELCCSRQKRILSGIFDSLKEDGIIIYSTCTFSEEENEENVKFIASQGNFDSVKIKLDPNWNINETIVTEGNTKYFSCRFYPHKVKGEGFFVSVLKKRSPVDGMNEQDYQPRFSKNKSTIPRISGNEKKIIAPWLKNADEFEFLHWKNEIYAMLKTHFDQLDFLFLKINFHSFGICIGRIIQDDLIPSHALAVSTIISDKIQSVELNEENALRFLRRQDLSHREFFVKGWTIVKFNGHNLGWIKILENRVNNYFPKEYRILKTA